MSEPNRQAMADPLNDRLPPRIRSTSTRLGVAAMSARDDYPWASHGHVQYLLAEIDRLRAELTVANNRLGNAVGVLIDAGTYCTGVNDVTAGIDRLRAERETWEAIRQTVNCPTCGGTCAIEGPERREVIYDAETGEPCGETLCDPRIPCPDNCDGKIDMARLLAVAAAVFTAIAKRDAAYAARESGTIANIVALAEIESAMRVRP